MTAALDSLPPLPVEGAVIGASSVYARALDARDARFDGLFFVGITSTRIYCRPVCPARVSYPERRRFFRSAAAAERAGFRPCLRCRPELAPGRAQVDALSRLARAAARCIAAGALNGRSVAALARELGVSERHLRRALEREIGVSPVELAQTHRLLLAQQLLLDTALPVTRVAYASGFQSLRRFNDAFRAQYRTAPSTVRRAARGERAVSSSASGSAGDAPLRLTLAYREPFAWDVLLDELRRDAIAGVETVDGRRYARTVELEGRRGMICVEDAGVPSSRRKLIPPHVVIDVAAPLVPVLMPLLARMRHLLDLDAEPAAIDQDLAEGGLAAQVASRPGVRLLGAMDGFDVALRAIAGTKAGAIVRALGDRVITGMPGLDRLVPTAARIVDAGVETLVNVGVPRRGAAALVTVAERVAAGSLRLEPGSSVVATRRALAGIPGIGQRTATTIVMRTLDWPDAFPAEDASLWRAAGVTSARAMRACAERWRPWRAYAALHLRLAARSER